MNTGYLKYFGVLFCLFAIAAILPPASASYKLIPTTYGWENGCGTGANQNVSLSLDGSTATYTAPTDALQCVAYYDFGQVVTMQDVSIYHNYWLWASRPFRYSNTTVATQNWAGSIPVGQWFHLNSTPSLISVGHRGYVVLTDGGAFNLSEIEFYGYYGTTPPPPTANFTGAPTSGTVPLTVSFTDTSTNLTGSETFNWSVSPAPGVSITTPAAQNTQMTFGTIGNYTIVHGVNNSLYSSIKTKTDYIYVYNSTGTTTLHVTAINAMNAYPIHGAQVNLYDVENTSWSNTTTTAGTGSITSLSDHHVNAYVSAGGFLDNDKLGIPVSNVYDSVLLFPTNTTNVSAGNVTLFVSVFDDADHSKPVVGAGVTVITASSSQGQFTNSGGSAQFAVPNKTTVLIDVEAVGQGYNGATQSVYTGTGSGASASVTATVYLSKKTVTPTIPVPTISGGGTATPTITILPGCEDPMSAACQASQNDYSMGWLSQNGLMLIQFFVICFIIFMFKGMGK